MIVAKITQEVKDIIQDKTVYVPISTSLNCVPDCVYNWITTVEEITSYNNLYDPVEYEEIEWCLPCFDEDTLEQIPCE